MSEDQLHFVDWGETVSIYKGDSKVELSNEDLKFLYNFIDSRRFDKIVIKCSGGDAE